MAFRWAAAAAGRAAGLHEEVPIRRDRIVAIPRQSDAMNIATHKILALLPTEGTVWGLGFGRGASAPSLRSDLTGPATARLGLWVGSGASSALWEPARRRPPRGPSVTEPCRAELARLRFFPFHRVFRSAGTRRTGVASALHFPSVGRGTKILGGGHGHREAGSGCAEWHSAVGAIGAHASQCRASHRTSRISTREHQRLLPAVQPARACACRLQSRATVHRRCG